MIVLCLMLVSSCQAMEPELKDALNGPVALRQASQEWKVAVIRSDTSVIIDLAEESSTKQALKESLSDPNDVLAQYFFGSDNSVRTFFSRNAYLRQKIIRVGETNTYYVCYYDPDRFKGSWSMERLREYSLDLNTIVCESFYERDGRWYLDFDMPLFDGD